jgi:hypothetical protein
MIRLYCEDCIGIAMTLLSGVSYQESAARTLLSRESITSLGEQNWKQKAREGGTHTGTKILLHAPADVCFQVCGL